MKNKVKIIIAVLFLATISTHVHAQYTRQQAINLVTNTIVGSSSSSIIYTAYNAFPLSQDVELHDYSSITPAYSNNWVFFVDDMPVAQWHHDCRYIFVNTVNGSYTLENESIYPMDLKTDFEMVTTLPSPPSNSIPAYTGDGATFEEENDHLYAVIIGGDEDSWVWTDVSLVYNTLLEQGYKKDNIFVHFSNADGHYLGEIYDDDLDGGDWSDDIDYPAYFGDIETTFENLAGTSNSKPEIPALGPDDHLLIHLDSHGNSYGSGISFLIIPYSSPQGMQFFDYDLADMLEPINCGEMLITVQCCYSGGFIDDLTDYTTYNVDCENRKVITACEADNKAVSEAHITGYPYPEGLDVGVYGEFTFYFYSALRGFYPDVSGIGGFKPWVVSAELGQFPFYLYDTAVGGTFVQHPPDYNPDVSIGNNDGIIQIQEAFTYADHFDSWSGEGMPPNVNYFCPHPEFDYLYETPQNAETGLFEEDLLTLVGLTGEIENTQTVNGNFVIGGPLSVTNNAILTVSSGSEFYFIDDVITVGGVDQDVIFDVKPNCGLSLGDNVKFHGFDTKNLVDVNGNITFGLNNQFLSHTGNVWNGLSLKNQNATISISNATFEKAKMYSDVSSLTVSNSSFEDCGTIESDRGTIKFYNTCTFDNTGLDFENTLDDTKSATVDNCEFTNGSGKTAVLLKDYDRYNISDNEISGYFCGVYLDQVGDGKPIMQLVEDNTISSCTYGVHTFGSNGIVQNNQVSNCFRGVLTYDYSNIQLKGNSGAADETETQYIRDNSSYEVLASQYSFPSSFHYNIIEDNDNGSIPMVYHITTASLLYDVTNNCWGSGFNGASDFYPSGYIYNPQWCPPGYKSGMVLSPEEEMYNYANELFIDESYSVAREQYELLITQYPESEFAMNSLKELFALEQYVDNDYNALKEYYLTNTTVQSNDILTKVASHFVAKCNVKLQNWQNAIDHFEYNILNPETFEDSVFAIIDLGYVYFAMENSGYKAAYAGNLGQHIPQSKSQFIENRDYLLSLLPGELKSQQQPESVAALNSGELMQNVPNPFKGETQIWYKLENESTIQLNIFNYTGQLIRTINDGTKTKGSHFINFDASGLKNGIYFYSISINGQTSDSKKMTIIK